MVLRLYTFTSIPLSMHQLTNILTLTSIAQQSSIDVTIRNYLLGRLYGNAKMIHEQNKQPWAHVASLRHTRFYRKRKWFRLIKAHVSIAIDQVGETSHRKLAHD